MRQPNPNLTNRIMSFIGLGIFIVLFICAFVFLSYLLIIGAAVGLILFLIAYIRNRFFHKKQADGFINDNDQTHRIIDQDDHQ